MPIKTILISLIVLAILSSVSLGFILYSNHQNKSLVFSVTSSVQNISVSMEDSQSVINLMNSWGLYNKKIRFPGSDSPIKVDSVVIELTPKDQPYDQFMDIDKKTVVQSAGYSFEKGVLTIKIFLSPTKILTRDNNEVAEWLLSAGLMRINAIINNEYIDSDKVSKEVYQYVHNNKIINVEKN